MQLGEREDDSGQRGKARRVARAVQETADKPEEVGGRYALNLCG